MQRICRNLDLSRNPRRFFGFAETNAVWTRRINDPADNAVEGSTDGSSLLLLLLLLMIRFRENVSSVVSGTIGNCQAAVASPEQQFHE